MKTVVCKICNKELAERPVNCKNKDCPYREGRDENSFLDLWDMEKRKHPTGCLDFRAKGNSGCLGDFAGCLFLPFRWLFELAVGVFKVVVKVLSVFD